MNARVDFDAYLADSYAADEGRAQDREFAIDEAMPLATAEIMEAFRKAFADETCGIPLPVKNLNGGIASITLVDLSEAVADAWDGKHVESAFTRMCTCPDSDLVFCRDMWRTAIAMQYAEQHAEDLAIHRVENPEVYA
jgi:hypothetical protein